MIVTCPNCAKRYGLSDESVGAHGRKVRCANCGHIWWQNPPNSSNDDDNDEFDFEDGGLNSAASQAAPAPHSRGAAKPKSKGKAGRSRGGVLGWATFVVFLAGIVAGGWAARGEIVNLWPPAALLYDKIGIPVEPPGTGLRIQNVRSEQKLEGGSPVLMVEGQVVNVSDRVRAVPRLRAISLDSAGQPSQDWLIDPSSTRLLPGEVAVFVHAQREPGVVTQLQITFDGS